MDTIENWLQDIDQKEKENNFFYKTPITSIQISFLYISTDNFVTNINEITYDLQQENRLTKNELIYLISTYKKDNYRLLDILTYQMTLPANELKYIEGYDGLKSIKHLDDIMFDNIIDYFKDLTTVYVLLYKKKSTSTNTRRIHINSKHKYTRRMY